RRTQRGVARAWEAPDLRGRTEFCRCYRTRHDVNCIAFLGMWCARGALRCRAFCFTMLHISRFVGDTHGAVMAKKITRSRPWTKEEVRMLKTLTGAKTKMVIARKLKRSADAMSRLASRLGVRLERRSTQ